MINIDIKELFTLQGSRKSQAKGINAWYWSFQSKKTEHVRIEVTTFGMTARDKYEDDAWRELEKAVFVLVDDSTSSNQVAEGK